MPIKRAKQAAMDEFTDNVDMLMRTIGYSILVQAKEKEIET